MRALIIRVLVLVVIVVIVFSPLLLVVDYERFSPFVLLIWLVSIAYYLLVKRREDQAVEDREGGDEPASPGDVSRETKENCPKGDKKF